MHSVVAAWLVNFTLPYLLARLGSNIGWIYGSFGIICTVYAYFCVPELMNRSLEVTTDSYLEVGQVYANKTIIGAGRIIQSMVFLDM